MENTFNNVRQYLESLNNHFLGETISDHIEGIFLIMYMFKRVCLISFHKNELSSFKLLIFLIIFGHLSVLSNFSMAPEYSMVQTSICVAIFLLNNAQKVLVLYICILCCLNCQSQKVSICLSVCLSILLSIYFSIYPPPSFPHLEFWFLRLLEPQTVCPDCLLDFNIHSKCCHLDRSKPELQRTSTFYELQDKSSMFREACPSDLLDINLHHLAWVALAASLVLLYQQCSA